MSHAAHALLKSAFAELPVPPAQTPLRDVIAAWLQPVDADGEPTKRERIGAEAMADQMLDEMARKALDVLDVPTKFEN